MRYLPLLLISCALFGCSRHTTGLVLPAGEMLLLDEYQASGYRAEFENRGNAAVTLSVIGETEGEEVIEKQLLAGGAETVTVRENERVEVKNTGRQEVQLRITTNRGVRRLQLRATK